MIWSKKAKGKGKMDFENYIYHRPCFEKGPIGKIKSLSSEELREKLGW